MLVDKKLKNFLRGILVSASLSFVLTNVIACGSSNNVQQKKKAIDYEVDNVKPLDFKKVFGEAARNEPIFLGGINETTYSQGMSFIFNVINGLGWNW